MKTKSICALASLVFGSASAIAEQASPDIFQITKQCVITAGYQSAVIKVATAPAEKRMVIQTVSYTRGFAAPGSTSAPFLNTTTFGDVSYFTLPVLTSAGGLFGGGATLSATIYDGAGGEVSFTCNRTGDLTYSETDVVTITGYYVAKP